MLIVSQSGTYTCSDVVNRALYSTASTWITSARRMPALTQLFRHIVHLRTVVARKNKGGYTYDHCNESVCPFLWPVVALKSQGDFLFVPRPGVDI